MSIRLHRDRRLCRWLLCLCIVAAPSVARGAGDEQADGTLRLGSGAPRVDTLQVREPRRLRVTRPEHPTRRKHSMDIIIREARSSPEFDPFRTALEIHDFDACARNLSTVRDTARLEPVLREIAQFDLVELDFFRGDLDAARDGYHEYARQNRRGYLTNDAIGRLFLIEDNRDFDDRPLKSYAESEYLERVGRVDSALAVCRTILADYPGSVIRDDVYLQMGDLALATANPTDALPFFKAVTDSIPDTELAATAQMRIGKYYAEIAGDIPRAIEAYEQVLLAYPGSLEAPEARKILEKLRQET